MNTGDMPERGFVSLGKESVLTIVRFDQEDSTEH